KFRECYGVGGDDRRDGRRRRGQPHWRYSFAADRLRRDFRSSLKLPRDGLAWKAQPPLHLRLQRVGLAPKRKKAFLIFTSSFILQFSRAYSPMFPFSRRQKPRSGCAFFGNGRIITENR